MRACQAQAMKQLRFCRYLILILSFLGCTTAPKKAQTVHAEEVYSQLCEAGKNVKSITGRIWMKASSEEAKGRFPATVKVTPERLDLEVTNPLGGPVASITVQNNQYKVEEAGKEKRSFTGVDQWGGIPLIWANDLFVGKIPCINTAQAAQAQLVLRPLGEASLYEAGQLELVMSGPQGEAYTYEYDQQWGRYWARKLLWQRSGDQPLEVSFEFSRPESETRSPLHWSAKSERGEVKVLWKGRKVEKL